MPLPFAAGGIKVRLSGNIGSGEWGQIFHYHQATGADITDLSANTFASDLATSWATNIAPLVCPTCHLTQVVVEGLNSATDGAGAWAGDNAGGGSGDTPAQVCVLEKDVIAPRYRGGHPRHYWPVPSSADIGDPTHLNPGGVGVWFAGVTAYHSAAVTAGSGLWPAATFEYVNISYFSHHVVRPVPVISPIQGWSIETMLATQRRRVGR